MFSSNRSSVNIVRRTVDIHREILYASVKMVDRWVWLAHGRQIYCFLPFLGVLSLFKVHIYCRIFVRQTTRVSIF